jgi:hypothetical protein
MVHRGRVAVSSLLFGLLFAPTLAAQTKSAAPADKAGKESAEPDAASKDEGEGDEAETKASEKEPEGAKASLSVGGDSAPAAGDSPAGTGFVLRATLGGGFAWAQAPRTDSQVDLAAQTVGGMLLVQPGYEFLPGLAVHADLYASMNFAHKLRSDSEAIVYEKNKVGFIAPTVGIGVSYHALPADLFVSAGAGLSLLWGSEWFDAVGGTALTEPDVTGIGYAARGSVGKLFSVHRRWSVGGSLNYDFQTFGRRDDAVLSIKRAHTLWLGFSASFHPTRQ